MYKISNIIADTSKGVQGHEEVAYSIPCRNLKNKIERKERKTKQNQT